MELGKRSKDLTGQVFGSLTALYPTKVSNRTIYWMYRCVCGNNHEARGNTVSLQTIKHKNSLFPSCGCKELENKTKHGYRKSKNTHAAYRAYRAMMSRCYDSNNDTYKWYGEVGVTVCNEWKNNPVAFIEWSLKNGWNKHLHIDKDIICKDKGIFPGIYSPETCMWVTAKKNVGFATNRDNYGKHSNVKLSHQDVEDILKEFSLGNISKKDLAIKYNLKSSSSICRLVKLAKDKE